MLQTSDIEKYGIMESWPHLPFLSCFTYRDLACCTKYLKYLTRSSLLMF